MAVLNAKQRKALPDSDYGLPDERKFPLVDKNHVLKAIQFFKYCPDDKKKQLASNINKKAKEFGMKINCKGEFAKYISDENIKHADESCFEYKVDEASNIGTLSPIVGGIPTESDKGDELEEVDKVALGFSEEACTNPAYTCYDKSSKENINAINFQGIRAGTYLKNLKFYHNNTDSDPIKPETATRAVIHALDNFELDCMYDYMTNDFRNRESIFLARKKAIELMNDNSINPEDKMAQLATLVKFQPTKNEALIIFQTVYLMDREVAAGLVQYMNSRKDESFPNNFRMPYVDIFDYLDGDYSLKSEYSDTCPNTIINDLYYFGNYDNGIIVPDFALVDYLIKTRKMDKNTCIAISKMHGVEILNALRHMMNIEAIDWYAFIYYGKNDYAAYIGLDIQVYRLFQVEEKSKNYRPSYIAYLIGSMNGREIQIDNLFYNKLTDDDFAKLRVITLDPWKPGYNKCDCFKYGTTTEAMSAIFNNDNKLDSIKGIHIDRHTHEPYLGFAPTVDKVTDLYTKCHEIMPKNFKEKNFDDMKDNLSLSFYMVANIHNKLDNEYDINNPECQELKRLCSLLTSDFKAYLNKLEKEEPSFEFMNYFFENMLADSKEKEVKDLFTKSFETIQYWW